MLSAILVLSCGTESKAVCSGRYSLTVSAAWLISSCNSAETSSFCSDCPACRVSAGDSSLPLSLASTVRSSALSAAEREAVLAEASSEDASSAPVFPRAWLLLAPRADASSSLSFLRDLFALLLRLLDFGPGLLQQFSRL